MGLFRRDPPPRPSGAFRIHRPRDRRSLTASAVSVGVQDRREQNEMPSGRSGKITRALDMYDRCGECWYPSQFYSRAMRRIRFFPAILNENGEPEEVEDGPLREMFDRIRDPGGAAFHGLAENYGRLRFLIGDGYLIVTEQDKQEAWEYVSPLELKKQQNTSPVKWERDTGVDKETYTEAADFEDITGDRARVLRLHRRHPTRSGWSDAPVLSVLDLYETLISLTLAMGAEALSRAANRGLLFVPEELTIVPMGDDEQGTDEDPEADPFLREFIEGLTTGIENPGSAGAMSPFLLRGPGLLEGHDGRAIPTAQALKWMALGPQDRYLEVEAADKVIERIALGLDLPKEMVTGTGDVNHWGGWLLDEQGFRQHVAPVVEEFCDDLASAYLRHAAIADNMPDAERVVVWYDPVEAIAHPDEVPVAKDAWDRGIISSAYYRDKIGATDDDVPTDEDLALLLALSGRAADALDPTADPEAETPPEEGGTGADTNEGTPETNPADGGQNGNGEVASALKAKAAMVLGAAEMQVRAARKSAGSRLVQRSKNCAECVEAIRDVSHPLVAFTLGADRVREIIHGRCEEATLVAGAGAQLASQLREWGVRGVFPEELGRMVEVHALRTLYAEKPPPLPSAFAAAVARALR